MGVDVDLISVYASESTWFCVGVENDLVQSCDRMNLDFVLEGMRN